MIAAMRILMAISSPAYMSGTDIYPLIVLKLVSLTLKYGNAPESFFAYSGYSTILCGALDDFDTGYRFGMLSIELMEKFNALNIKIKVITLFNIFIRHWKEHMKEALPSYKEGYKTGLEYGDLEYGCYCLYMHSFQSFSTGADLSDLRQTMEQSARQFVQLRQKPSFNMFHPWHQTVINLIEKPDCVLSGSACNEDKLLSELVETDDKTGLYSFYFSKFILNYIFQDYPEAVKNIQLAEKYLKSIIATVSTMVFPFYNILAHLAVYDQSSENEKKKILKKVAANLKKLKKYTASAPMNCLNKLYLAQAEQARVLNQDAGKLYEKSVMSAKENGFVHEEAIANELAAKYYMSEEMITVAKAYLQNAHAAYRRWGAKTKVLQMEQNYADFLKTAGKKHTATETIRTTSDTTDQLDLTSIIKASQALSGEIELNRLIRSMMRIILENAGAERGFFIAKENKELIIMAEGRKDTDEIQTDTPVPLSEADSEESPYSLSVPVVRYAERTGQTVVLNNAFEQGQFVNTPYVKKYKPKSVLCAPIVRHDKLHAVVYLENSLAANAFTEHGLEVLNILSAQFAISMENARLYASLEQTTKIATEMEIAANIQSGLIPKEPAIKGYEISAYMEPADDVGGDYYDIINFEDRDWMVIGDVSGHGVSAGLVMLMVQASLHSVLSLKAQIDPSDLLTVINKTIAENIRKIGED
ncbi:MAG: GAF domain-containing protein, partial [Desulfobacterales bacterium]|nr:GAF domain-containing protein [Desulfobacterales bacterium]